MTLSQWTVAEWSAVAQAVTSCVAIIAAILIASRQHRESIKIDRARRYLDAQKRVGAVLPMVIDAGFLLNNEVARFMHLDMVDAALRTPLDEDRWTWAWESLVEIPIHELPSPALISRLLYLRLNFRTVWHNLRVIRRAHALGQDVEQLRLGLLKSQVNYLDIQAQILQVATDYDAPSRLYRKEAVERGAPAPVGSPRRRIAIPVAWFKRQCVRSWTFLSRLFH